MQVFDELGQLQVSTGVGAGDITGPAVSTDNAIARWNGAGGDTLQNSGILIDDSGNLDMNNNSINNVLAIEAENVKTRRLENLCRNAAFASRSGGTSAVMDEWALEGTPTVAYDTVDAGYGDHAVKLTATGAGDEGIKITLTHLKPLTKYQVFARVKVDAGDTASLITTGADTNINVDSTSTAWENIEGEFTTDGSGTDVVIKLVASADTDVAYFCGITCVEGDIPPGNFIRRNNEVIYLQIAVADASYTGNAFSTGTATLDLSAFGNGCPAGIKAVLVALMGRDSGSAASGNCQLRIRPHVGASGRCVENRLEGRIDDGFVATYGWAPCDSNGDVRWDVTATGANTFDVWITVWGWVLS